MFARARVLYKGHIMRFSSRKFIIAESLLILTTVLGMYDKMESGAIGLVFALIGAGYGLVNHMDKRLEKQGDE